MPTSPAPALTGSQAERWTSRNARIAGHILRLARQSVPAGYSQERLAESMNVSPDTVAGWETGRRPLASVTAGRFLRLQETLIRARAAPSLVRLIGVGLEADQILDQLTGCARREAGEPHPLGGRVHRREVIELIAWPLSSRPPASLPAAQAYRGPAAPAPALPPAEHAAAFDHLRRIAETAGSDTLLRRQALYLQSYDRRPDAAAWMTEQYRQLPRQHNGWAPDWPAARTLAAAMARYGNPEPLIDFCDYGLADEAGLAANLNYWAYWVGEITTAEPDDSFMPARLRAWSGDQILSHLTPRLVVGPGITDLGLHTLRTLVVARPVLAAHPALAADLARQAEQLPAAADLPSPARRALAEIRCALRPHIR